MRRRSPREREKARRKVEGAVRQAGAQFVIRNLAQLLILVGGPGDQGPGRGIRPVKPGERRRKMANRTKCLCPVPPF